MVGAAVHDEDIVLEGRGHLRRLTVRKREEHHVVARQRRCAGLLYDMVGQRHQMGLQVCDEGAGTGGGGQRTDLDLRVLAEQP